MARIIIGVIAIFVVIAIGWAVLDPGDDVAEGETETSEPAGPVVASDQTETDTSDAAAVPPDGQVDDLGATGGELEEAMETDAGGGAADTEGSASLVESEGTADAGATDTGASDTAATDTDTAATDTAVSDTAATESSDGADTASDTTGDAANGQEVDTSADGESSETEENATDVGAASAAATDAAVEAIEDGEDPVQGAQEEAQAASAEAGSVGAAAFQPDGYDAETVRQAILDSDLQDSEKDALLLNLDGAEDEEALEIALTNVREALDIGEGE